MKIGNSLSNSYFHSDVSVISRILFRYLLLGEKMNLRIFVVDISICVREFLISAGIIVLPFHPVSQFF